MQKIVLVLLGMASLAASGIITDRISGGLDMISGLGIGLQGGQGKLKEHQELFSDFLISLNLKAACKALLSTTKAWARRVWAL